MIVVVLLIELVIIATTGLAAVVSGFQKQNILKTSTSRIVRSNTMIGGGRTAVISSSSSRIGGLQQLQLLLRRTRRTRSCSWNSSPYFSTTTTTSSSRRPLVVLFSSTSNYYDVIVVGGGHAGCEAAAAAARTGATTCLVTQRIDTIGELSCNPSIGGIGKGHLVREIDALDGVMGDVADCAGIHFRLLNRSKGPAVRGNRAQVDRDLYKFYMQQRILTKDPNTVVLPLTVHEGSVEDLLLDEGLRIDSLAPLSTSSSSKTTSSSSSSEEKTKRASHYASSEYTQAERKARIRGVQLADGTELYSRAVILTTGTFLRGILMIGKERYAGGRHLRDSEQVEPPSVGLSKTLERFGFTLGRLKTGTPARLDGETIDWDACIVQPSENPPCHFSYLREFATSSSQSSTSTSHHHRNPLINCYKSSTNDLTHKIVMDYAHLLPQYDGGLDGTGNGPRYCPSIYKKVQRFPDRLSHTSFLEPEGLNTNVIYPQGMSGPYPPEIQLKLFRTMVGLEQVEIIRPGYDVEYDFVNPKTSLTHTMESKRIGGFYLAGQICGTTGYEEAAAQGIVAGANAGRAAGCASRGEAPPSPFVLGRDEAYIGVLIDDLVTRGTSEPYRMFTSRAEYRISLRSDNADLRLTQRGIDFGLVRNEERIATLEARQLMIHSSLERLRSFKLLVSDWTATKKGTVMGGGTEGQKKSAEEILSMPHVTLKDVEDIMTEQGRKLLQEAEDETSSSGEEELYYYYSGSNTVDDDNTTNNPIPMTKQDFLRTKGQTLLNPSPPSVYDTVEATVKYSNYLGRQAKDMESWRKAQGVRIPTDLVYDQSIFPTLSSEEIEKLSQIRPSTFAEASNISGVTPQSLIYLYQHIQKRARQRDRERAATAVAAADTKAYSKSLT